MIARDDLTHERGCGTLPAAVLFDMDGTLVDTEWMWSAAVAEVAGRRGRPLTDADGPHVLGRDSAYTATYLLRTGVGEVNTSDLAGELDGEFTRRVAAGTDARPGVVRLLDELATAGVPAAIVSASPRAVVDLVRDHLGHDLFVLTVAVEDAPRSKPAPDPYLAAAAALGVPPSRCVVIEDTPVGVAAAEAAGCPVLAVPSTVPIAAAAGRRVIPSLEQADLRLLTSVVSGGA